MEDRPGTSHFCAKIYTRHSAICRIFMTLLYIWIFPGGKDDHVCGSTELRGPYSTVSGASTHEAQSKYKPNDETRAHRAVPF